MDLKLPELSTNDLPNSMREALQKELQRRCQVNPRYSLRAFARALEINPSHLSKILNGQIGISEDKFEHFITVLKLPNTIVQHLKRRDFFLREIEKQGQWMERVEKQVEFLNLSLDQFRVMADWYHYAILELTRLADFQSDVSWIEARLGLSGTETQDAVDRLFRLNMLVKSDDGKWKDNSDHVSNGTPSGTADARRDLQKQILNLALGALDDIPVEERLQSSMTMAVSRNQIEKAKQGIVTFQRAFATLLQEESEKKDSVYKLSISFFPVTKKVDVL
ncbi:TIGR02147 family protein [Bdellovibrio bacteriovorus]|uniref:TIGR02147 family protein n=1 Tax=Bdellovibrio bacteriovorus TaxID=959 RepID=UPI0035A571A2